MLNTDACSYADIYWTDLSKLIGLSVRQTEVLKYFVNDFYSDDINLTFNKKNIICKALKLSDGGFKNILTKMIQSGILIRKNKCVYCVNPVYDINKRLDGIKIILQYNKKGKSLSIR
jgi:hypothetical protein